MDKHEGDPPVLVSIALVKSLNLNVGGSGDFHPAQKKWQRWQYVCHPLDQGIQESPLPHNRSAHQQRPDPTSPCWHEGGSQIEETHMGKNHGSLPVSGQHKADTLRVAATGKLILKTPRESLETDVSPVKLPDESTALPTLWIQPRGTLKELLAHRNCEIVDRGCFKPLCVW